MHISTQYNNVRTGQYRQYSQTYLISEIACVKRYSIYIRVQSAKRRSNLKIFLTFH